MAQIRLNDKFVRKYTLMKKVLTYFGNITNTNSIVGSNFTLSIPITNELKGSNFTLIISSVNNNEYVFTGNTYISRNNTHTFEFVGHFNSYGDKIINISLYRNGILVETKEYELEVISFTKLNTIYSDPTLSNINFNLYIPIFNSGSSGQFYVIVSSLDSSSYAFTGSTQTINSGGTYTWNYYNSLPVGGARTINIKLYSGILLTDEIDYVTHNDYVYMAYSNFTPDYQVVYNYNTTITAGYHNHFHLICNHTWSCQWFNKFDPQQPSAADLPGGVDITSGFGNNTITTSISSGINYSTTQKGARIEFYDWTGTLIFTNYVVQLQFPKSYTY